MAILSLSDLRDQINTDIQTNGVRDITGPVMNTQLIDVVDSLEAVIQSSDTLAEILANGNDSGPNNISMDAGTAIRFNEGSGGGLISASTTADRTWTLPNKTGTVAMLSDIPASVNIYNTSSTIGSSRALGITDNVTFGTNLLYLEDDTEFFVGIGKTVPSNPGTEIFGINGESRFSSLNATSGTTALIIDDGATVTFSVRGDGRVDSRDGYWIGNNLVLHVGGGANSMFGGVNAGPNSTGITNTGFGKSALVANVAGFQNNAFGASSMQSMVSGFANAAFANSSLVSATGNSNAAFGVKSYQNLGAGNNHTGAGQSSGRNVQSGSGTICIG